MVIALLQVPVLKWILEALENSARSACIHFEKDLGSKLSFPTGSPHRGLCCFIYNGCDDVHCSMVLQLNNDNVCTVLSTVSGLTH